MPYAYAAPLLLLLLFKATKVALSKQEEKKPKKELEPLGAVVFSFLDKNRDKEVTIPEMNNQLMVLDELSQEGGGGDKETEELRLVFKRLRKAAPYIFNLLDQDEDRRLDKDEARVITQFEDSLNHNGNARIILREWFEILDDDVDERLDADEILESTRSDFIVGEIAGTLHQFYPLRDTALELRKHIRRAMNVIWGEELDKESVAEGMKWLDYDGDGYIQWSELTDAYNSFGKKFLYMSQQIKEAGPMMGLFGDPSKAKGDKGKAGSLFKEKMNIQSDFDMRTEL